AAGGLARQLSAYAGDERDFIRRGAPSSGVADVSVELFLQAVAPDRRRSQTKPRDRKRVLLVFDGGLRHSRCPASLYARQRCVAQDGGIEAGRSAGEDGAGDLWPPRCAYRDGVAECAQEREAS